VARAVDAAQAGAARMAAMPAHARFAVLEAVARRIEAGQPELGRLLCRENGKRIGEATSEVGVAARIFRGYAEEAKRVFGRAFPLDAVPGRERSLAVTRREPVGVVAALANDSPFGLQAAVFTRGLGRAMRAWQALDVGTVVVNHTTAVRVETLPFGGNKASGNAREGIHDTLHAMTKEKTLLLHEVLA
jgi:lactaldehyde dehydrogenase